MVVVNGWKRLPDQVAPGEVMKREGRNRVDLCGCAAVSLAKGVSFLEVAPMMVRWSNALDLSWSRMGEKITGYGSDGIDTPDDARCGS